MGAAEEGTLARLKAVRESLVDPAIASHHGRIVKTTGDGLLVEFASAVDATRCSVEVQRAMAAQNADVPQEVRIQYRIGIHVGDIIIDDDDIFGDGVNIAARLEGIAEPGGVCISDDAYRQVRGKVEIGWDDIGPQALKNIAEPMRAWRVQLAGQAAAKAQPGLSAPALPLPDKPSIAVLPFQNMSGDPEQEYFADGVVGDIITALSRFKSLFVIARNSSFTYKGKAVDVRHVSRELGVRYVLEGSVRKAGQKVRITGQLIDASTGGHLWADRFDGDLANIFELQDDITGSVVGAIDPKIQALEFERIKLKPTENMSAYDHYLRGLSKMYQFKREAVEEAEPLLRKAIELDRDFAAPYAVAAFRYGVRQTFGWGAVTANEKSMVVGLGHRAIELAADDAFVLTYAGYALALLAHEFDFAASCLERAITANPNLAVARTYRGLINMHLGNHEIAIDDLNRAARLSPLDPLSYIPKIGLAQTNFFLDRHAEAVKWASEAVLARPDFLTAHRWAMVCHAFNDDLDAARNAWEVAKGMDPTQSLGEVRWRTPLKRERDHQKFVEGLRRAGVPE